MNRIETKARVGPNGVLELRFPVGNDTAGREVCVTVEIVPPRMSVEEWQARVMRTAGTWQGDFELPD